MATISRSGAALGPRAGGFSRGASISLLSGLRGLTVSPRTGGSPRSLGGPGRSGAAHGLGAALGVRVPVARQEHVGRDAVQAVQRPHRQRRVLVEAGGHDLRTEPAGERVAGHQRVAGQQHPPDRKSTRLNSSHPSISYAVFCLKKKKKINKLMFIIKKKNKKKIFK